MYIQFSELFNLKFLKMTSFGPSDILEHGEELKQILTRVGIYGPRTDFSQNPTQGRFCREKNDFNRFRIPELELHMLQHKQLVIHFMIRIAPSWQHWDSLQQLLLEGLPYKLSKR